MKKILHVTPLPGMALRFLSGLIKAQINRAYEVHVACGPGNGFADLEALGVKSHQVDLTRRFLSRNHISAYQQLRSLCIRECFDLVHSHAPIASFVARLAAKSAGIRSVVYHMHGTPWGMPGFKSWLFTRLERYAAKNTDFIFTVNCEDAADCIKKLKVPPSRVECLHVGAVGIRLDGFPIPDVRIAMQGQMRKHLGISKSDLVVGYVGRMVPEKGINELVQAFRVLCDAKLNVKLLMVGDTLVSDRSRGTLDIALRQHFGDSRAQDLAIAVGSQKDPIPYMAAMDVLCLPSHREGFGMVLAEAAALSIPVVATATRGAKEAVADGVTGVITPIGQPHKLAQTLRSLLDDPDRRRIMGSHAKARAEAQFDEAHPISKVLEIYGRLVQPGVSEDVPEIVKTGVGWLA
jgi:glycosyltransferase involved in cell wall biosynthesis